LQCNARNVCGDANDKTKNRIGAKKTGANKQLRTILSSYDGFKEFTKATPDGAQPKVKVESSEPSISQSKLKKKNKKQVMEKLPKRDSNESNRKSNTENILTSNKTNPESQILEKSGDKKTKISQNPNIKNAARMDATSSRSKFLHEKYPEKTRCRTPKEWENQMNPNNRLMEIFRNFTKRSYLVKTIKLEPLDA
jgi:hypothetical protein